MKNTQREVVDSKPFFSPIIIIGILFFIFGFITWLNSVLIPYLKIACELTNVESYMVAFAFYMAYFVMAIPSGWVLKWIGYKNGISVGLIIISIGAVIFIPAAITRLYYIFLLGLFVQGTGLAVLQTASNPYITILGPLETAAKRISIMGICNKIAGGIAPIVLGAVALKNVDQLVTSFSAMTVVQKQVELDTLAGRVILPYSIITIVLIALAIGIYFSTLPEIENEKSDVVDETVLKKTSVFQFPHLVLGVVTLFLYVGVEVLAGDSIISYAASEHIPLSTAKFFTTCTLFAMILGYVVGIVCIPKFISQDRVLFYSGALGIVLSIIVIATSGYVSVFFLALLGLANALVWPAIWPLALQGLGKFTKMGSSLLIMGIAGGAIIPLLYGKLADVFSIHMAYLILIPCYLFIFYYGGWGRKVRS